MVQLEDSAGDSGDLRWGKPCAPAARYRPAAAYARHFSDRALRVGRDTRAAIARKLRRNLPHVLEALRDKPQVESPLSC